jgi:hypothetical protein
MKQRYYLDMSLKYLPIIPLPIILVLLLFHIGSVLAQVSSVWSTPQLIPGYEGDNRTSNLIRPPYLVVDSSGTVHAINSLILNDDLLIYYSEWNINSGWSQPVDILFSPETNARVCGVSLDGAGQIHTAFYGGNEIQANIYYARAPLAQAGNSRAWSQPEVIGEQALSSEAVMIGDGNQFLALVYSGKMDGNGLYYVYSEDNGDSWTDPEPIYLTYSNVLWPTHLDMILDDQGRIHLVWSVVGVSGNGEAVYYTRIGSDHIQDIDPTVLATVTAYEADWPSITTYKDELFLVYNNGQPSTRWFIKSSDGGLTWSFPVRPFPHEGEYGAARFVTDSNENLFMFLGNRVGNPAYHGMWYSIWQEGYWLSLTPIISGPRVVSPPGKDGFDPSVPRGVVLQGNVLLIVWRTDAGAGPNGVWYSYATLDSPALIATPMHIETKEVLYEETPDTQSISFPTETPSGTLIEIDRAFREEPVFRMNLQSVMVISITPVLMLILLFIIVHRINSFKQ